MIEAAVFQGLNPNNSRRRVTRLMGTDWVKGNGIDAVELTEDKLLIFSPTVPGFSLGDKLWHELFSSNSGTIRQTDLCSGICSR